MTTEEAFRFGFLKTCAESGIHPTSASLMLDQVEGASPTKAAGILRDAVSTSAGISLPLLALATVGIPGGLGYAAGRVTSPPFNAADARDEELAETYRQNTDRLRLARMGRQRSAELMQPRV